MGNPPQTGGSIIFSGREFCALLRVGVRYGIYLTSEELLVTQERWNLNEVTEVILILSLGKIHAVYHSAFSYI